MFLRNLFMFLGILALVYPLLIILTGLSVPQVFKPNISYKLGAYGNLHSRIKELKDSVSDVDLLFLGSSHAYRGFDTRNFKGWRSFNLGSSAQSPVNTQVLLHRYLDKLNPKTVVYEVYPGSFAGDGAESSLDIISNDRNDKYSLIMTCRSRNIKVFNTFIYASFRDLLSLNRNFREKPAGGDRYIQGGFVESEIRYFRHIRHRQREWKFNEEQLEAFSENLELLKRKNAEVILVFAPVTSGLYSSYTNNHYVDSLMKSYRLRYYNFNTLITLNDSADFYDPHHLNQNGVNKFNAALNNVLSNG
jgi:hypothetical protein